MRTDAEQIEGLHEIGRRLMEAGCNGVMIIAPSDVPAMTSDGDVEVVFAAGGYDVWREGHLAETDLSAEQAAQVLIDIYRELGRSV